MSSQPALVNAPEAAPTINYALPEPRMGHRVWAGAALLLGGLGLLVIAGCFLIGVLTLVAPALTFAGLPQNPSLTAPQQVLMGILYACTFGSLVGGVSLLVMGTRGLLAIMWR